MQRLRGHIGALDLKPPKRLASMKKRFRRHARIAGAISCRGYSRAEAKIDRAQDQSEDRAATQSRHVQDACCCRDARTRGAVFQTALIGGATATEPTPP